MKRDFSKGSTEQLIHALKSKIASLTGEMGSVELSNDINTEESITGSQYKGFEIQDGESSTLVRNSKGEIVAEVPTPDEATRWIDENTDVSASQTVQCSESEEIDIKDYLEELTQQISDKLKDNVDISFDYNNEHYYLMIVTDSDVTQYDVPIDDLIMNTDIDVSYILDEIASSSIAFVEHARKKVRDTDGFLTDYTMYQNIVTGQFVFVFGDADIYKPEDEDWDYECDTVEEAVEWFHSYEGPYEEDEEDDYGEW